jgi:hypothetical protein
LRVKEETRKRKIWEFKEEDVTLERKIII